MGILDKLLNKKRAHRNNWTNAPYHSPQPNFHNNMFNQSYSDIRQADLEEQRYYNVMNESRMPYEWGYQNPQFSQPNWSYQNNQFTQPSLELQNNQFTQNDLGLQNIKNIQPREPVTQPFYGNPLTIESNFYNGPYNGQSQNSSYPNGEQNYVNHYQTFQPGGLEQGYYHNGITQQGIQPNPFQANPFFQQPLQHNAMLNKQNSGISSVVNQFKSQNGSIDINKMMSTAGQMVSAVNQFTGILKGLGGIFKA